MAYWASQFLRSLVSAIRPVTLEAPLQFSGNLVVVAVTYPSADLNSVALISRVAISRTHERLLQLVQALAVEDTHDKSAGELID